MDPSRLRIPIFFKFAVLSSLLSIAVISAVSLSILEKQKLQFVEQLINLGETLVRVAARDIPSKLLAEEDLSLNQLMNAIASNQQVSFALITDTGNTIIADSDLAATRGRYTPPENLTAYRISGPVIISAFGSEDDQSFLFEEDITMQGKRLGVVRIAVSQKSIRESIRNALRRVAGR